MNLEIRLATRGDWVLLNQLYADMDGEPPLAVEEAEKILTAITETPHYHIYLACLEEETVGTFSLLYAPTMMHRGCHRFAVLDVVTVISTMRGRGIGREMVRKALQLSSEAGCYKVTLSSNLKRDRAHEFYRSLGFEQHGWSFKCVIHQ